MDIYTLLDLVLFPVIIGYIALGKREWRYRVLRIKYRLHYQFESDGNLKRVPIKKSSVMHHSPASYEYDGGYWLVGGSEETFFSKGRPACVYNHDDARPRKIYGQSDAKLPASLIMNGYENDGIERAHKLAEPKVKGSTIFIIFLLVIIILSLFGVLYYEQNIACAVHSAACVKSS